MIRKIYKCKIIVRKNICFVGINTHFPCQKLAFVAEIRLFYLILPGKTFQEIKGCKIYEREDRGTAQKT